MSLWLLKRIWPIFYKELVHIVRDPRTLLMLLFFPAFLLVLFGYAVSFDVNHIQLGVLDQDKTSVSRNFVASFTHSGYFDLAENLSSVSQVKEGLDSGRLKVALTIPRGFAADLTARRGMALQVLVDGSDPTTASAVLGYVNSIIQEQTKLAPLVKMESRLWYNQELRSLNFYLPGLIAVILMMMSATLTSLTIVTEKENGSLESLIVSPIKKNELMLGKILPYVFIAFFDVLITVLVAVFWFSVPLKGSLVLLFSSSFVFLVGAMGIGLLISANAKTSQEAMQVALMIAMLPTYLLSGFVFPIENMPWILQRLTYLVPARYFLEILRGIFLKGVGLRYLWWDCLMLVIFSILIILASAKRFKKRLE